MNQAKPKARLELDPARIARIINAAVVVSTEVVNFHFNAVDRANLSEPIEPPNSPLFGFRGGNLTAEQRRSVIENWVLAKAFQELLRAVRHALEIAHVFTSLLGKSYTVRSDTSVVDFLRPFEAKAGDDRAEVKLFMRIEERKRSLALGEQIRFTLREFNEVAFACHFLGSQLALKMPKPDHEATKV